MTALDGKVAILTGSAGGRGAEIARAFADEGARLVLVDLDGEGLADTDHWIAERAADCALRAWDRIDVLVNCAQALSPPLPLIKHNQGLFDRMIRSGLYGGRYIERTQIYAKPSDRLERRQTPVLHNSSSRQLVSAEAGATPDRKC